MKRLKELEHENGRLKRMHADVSLDNAALKNLIVKSTKARGAAGGRHAFGDTGQSSGSMACAAVGLGRATYYWPLVDWAGVMRRRP